jgi:ketosteroid isomerase-like protein
MPDRPELESLQGSASLAVGPGSTFEMGSLASPADVVRAAFDAYLNQDRDAAERLLADDFVFTSPQDDHINKAAFLERCFPTADRLVSQETLRLVPADAQSVFILYEYELKSGARHRNTEYITVRDGQLVETQVFFGGVVS